MQDAGVVSILDILGVELPIVRQYLDAATDDTGRPVQHSADPAGDFRPEIGFEVGRVVAEGSENQSGKLRHAQPLKVVFVLAEFRGHAALPLDAALEGDTGQLPGQIISPAVIDAADLLDIAAALETEQ